MTKSLIQAENLTITFETRAGVIVALSNLNLEIHEGEIVVLAGETGSGKSTFGSSLLDLLDQTAVCHAASRILFQGKQIFPDRKNEMKQVRGRVITSIAQNPLLALNPTRRCGVQVSEVVRAFLGEVPRKERKEYVYNLLQECNLTEVERIYRSYPHQLSLGQLQRVLVSMALAPRPKLIIADEPFSSLDNITKTSLVQLLLRIREKHRVSILLITHDLGLIELMADRWYVLKEGKLHGQGSGAFLSKSHSEPYINELIQSYNRLSQASADAAKNEKALLSIKDLSFSYRHRKDFLARHESKDVLRNISFNVKEGDFFGIVGRSGSGKSTVAMIVGGLLDQYSGLVQLRGMDIREDLAIDRRIHFKKVQYLLQEAGSSLPPRMIMEQMLRLTIKAFHRHLPEDTIRSRIKRLMEDMQLDIQLLLRYSHQLSGGEKQRMSIARALCAQPDLLILDESLTALDKTVQYEIIQLIKLLNEKQQVTIILVAHDLRLIQHCCNRILVLKDGQVDSFGPRNELLRRKPSPYVKKLMEAI